MSPPRSAPDYRNFPIRAKVSTRRRGPRAGFGAPLGHSSGMPSLRSWTAMLSRVSSENTMAALNFLMLRSG